MRTMQEARAPSTRAAYTYRWRVFTGWCQAQQTDPFLASTQDILLFLQMQLEARKSAVTLRGMLLKVLSDFHLSQSMELQSLPVSAADQLAFCPVRSVSENLPLVRMAAP